MTVFSLQELLLFALAALLLVLTPGPNMVYCVSRSLTQGPRAGLLSLVGVPLTAGFIAKFYLLVAAVDGSNWVLLGALIVGSAIGIYYYMRVIYYMSRKPEQQVSQAAPADGLAVRVLSGALIVIILLLGTVPQPLMAYIRSIL